MPVSVDTVYQRVLALANKEQRGYITPQEFNLFANQAQMEIFEQYFYDMKQFNRLPGKNQEYADALSMLYEKIGIFEMLEGNVWMEANMPAGTATTPTDWLEIPRNLIYKIGTVRVGNNQVELLNSKDFDLARTCPLTAPTGDRPIGMIAERGLRVAISSTEFATPGNPNMNISFIARPGRVEWAYVVVNDKALYNDNISVDFELHPSEETELVYKILKLAGINLKQEQVVQVGQSLESALINKEKI